MAVTSVASLGPHWPPTLQLFILPVQHTGQYPQFAEAMGEAPLRALEVTPKTRATTLPAERCGSHMIAGAWRGGERKEIKQWEIDWGV